MRALVFSLTFLLWQDFASAGPQLREPLTYEAVQVFIRENKIRTRAELLQALPENVRKNAKLIQETASTVSPASALEPRMLLTSTDAKGNVFALTISGSLTDPDALLVEVAESVRPPASPPPFNQAKVIKFNESTGAPPEFIEDPLRYFKGHATKDCTRCHGEDFRWVWNGQYNRWRGAYGSGHRQGGYRGYRMKGEEVDRIQAFRDTAVSHPIYRYLPPESITYENLSHANTDFNIDLAKANGRRMAETLRRHPEARRFDALLIQAFVDHGTYADLEPDAIVARLLSPDFLQYVPLEDRAAYQAQVPELARKTLRDIRAFERFLANTPRSPVPLHFNEEALATNYAVFRFVCERLGIDMSNWSLPLNRNYLGFNDGEFGGAINYARRPYLEDALRNRHPDSNATLLLGREFENGPEREALLREVFRRTNPAGLTSSETHVDSLVRQIRAGDNGNTFSHSVRQHLEFRLAPATNQRWPGYTSAADISKLSELLGYLTRHVYADAPPRDDAAVRRVYAEELARITKLALENPQLAPSSRGQLLAAFVANLPEKELTENFLQHFPALNGFLDLYRLNPQANEMAVALGHLRSSLQGEGRAPDTAAEAARLAFTANPEFAPSASTSRALENLLRLCRNGWAWLRK